MKKNFFITGKQGSGKTSLVLSLYKELKFPFCGYYTSDLVENNTRKGYIINNLKGNKGIFAHVDSPSEIRISKFGLDIDIFDLLAVQQIEECLEYFPNKIILMDEIGKKEFNSEKFKKIFDKAISSDNIVVATLTLRKNIGFLEKYFNRNDSTVFEINQNNRNTVKDKVKEMITEKYNSMRKEYSNIGYYAKLMEN